MKNLIGDGCAIELNKEKTYGWLHWRKYMLGREREVYEQRILAASKRARATHIKTLTQRIEGLEKLIEEQNKQADKK